MLVVLGLVPCAFPPLQPLQSVACRVLCLYSLAADGIDFQRGQAHAQIVTFNRLCGLAAPELGGYNTRVLCVGPARDGEP